MKTIVRISSVGIGIVGVGCLTFVLVRHYLRRKQKLYADDDKWQRVGFLKEIALYPIKSSSPVIVDEAECDVFGLSCLGFRDRGLIILNEIDQKDASVRVYPSMLKIKLKILTKDVLSLESDNEESITVELNDLVDTNRSTIIKNMKGYSLKLTECLSHQHAWVSRVILGKENGMRLYLADEPIFNKIFFSQAKHDFVPIMTVLDKSVEELNSKMAAENLAHHLQFRGNLLIQGSDNVAPYDDDNWSWIKIGEDPSTSTILRYIAPCFRCIMPNVNLCGERNKNCEPFKSLKRFRLRSHPKTPEMGIYFDVVKKGVIKSGDHVFVQYK